MKTITKNISKTLRAISLIAMLLAGTAGISKAQQNNYSGSWILNAEKSELGEMKMPAGLRIKQDRESITLDKQIRDEAGNDASYSETLTFDGKAAKKVFVNGGNTQTRLSTVRFDGPVLQLSAATEAQVGDQLIKVSNELRWELSADKKTLTISGRSAQPAGTENYIAVYEKQ